MVEAWAEARANDRRPSYLREAVKCVRRHLPAWWDRAASSITVSEAVRTLDAVKNAKGTIAANRTLSYARAAYGWAAKRQAVPFNPLSGLERPGCERPRDRVVSLEEIGAIWRASGAIENPAIRGFVRVLLLTMQRREEVASMRHSELSPDLMTWTLPAERVKNHRTHLVHLSDPVQTIVAELPRMAGNPHVFAGKQGKAIAAFSFAKKMIDERLLDSGTPIANWRFHDFRRAGVTALGDIGFAPHVCDRILNHVTGSIQGVAAVYRRTALLTERKAALEAWSRLVLASADGKSEVCWTRGAREKSVARGTGSKPDRPGCTSQSPL